MLDKIISRAKSAFGRYDRVMCQAKEFAWMTGEYPRYRRRVSIGRDLSQSAPLSMPREKGYMPFPSQAFGGTQPLVELGRKIYQRWLTDGVDPTQKTKVYFHNIMHPNDLDAHPEIMAFALNKELLGTLSGYFGFVPELSSIGLMVSTPAQRVTGSQHGHFDARDSHHVKVIVNVEDVGEKNGPLEFLPADLSMEVRQKTRNQHGFGGRFKDEGLFKILPRSRFLKGTGKAGEGLIVDTSNCLHFGSRVDQGYRLAWFIHFATFADYQKMEFTPNGSVLLANEPKRERFASDEATRLALDVQAH